MVGLVRNVRAERDAKAGHRQAFGCTQKALQDPEVQERLAQSGAETVPPERARPDVLRDHLKVEIDRWVPIIRKAGVLAQ
jgi:tripartite-type tricarboxylate transporter receptor subunit TctC